MVRVSCTNPGCTARYNVPESKLGRRATCATCGKPFLLQAPPPADALDDLAGLTRGELIEASQQADVPEAVPVMVGYAQSAPDVRSAAHGQTFLGALREYALALLLIPKTLVRPWNLVTLLIVWLLCSLQILAPFALCFGILMVVIINGWYLAYLLNVVVSGTANDGDLPELTLSDGVAEGILLPLFKFLAVAVIATLPVMVAAGVCVTWGEFSWIEAVLTTLMCIARDYESLFYLSPRAALVIWPALLLGMLLRPMLLLVVAIEGVPALCRIDLMIVTIARTLPAYILLLGLTLVCDLLPGWVAAAVLGEDASPQGALGTSFLLMLPAVLLAVVSMRAVGLFYHHMKAYFAWSWG